MDTGNIAAIIGILLAFLCYACTTIGEVALRVLAWQVPLNEAIGTNFSAQAVDKLRAVLPKTLAELFVMRLLLGVITIICLFALLSPENRINWWVESLVIAATAIALAALPRIVAGFVAPKARSMALATAPWMLLMRVLGSPLAGLIGPGPSPELPPRSSGDASSLGNSTVDENGVPQVLAPMNDEHEQRMIQSILELDTTTAREIMTPRVDLVAVSGDGTLSEVASGILDKGYDHIPVYDGTIDHVIGVINARDYIRAVSASSPPPSLHSLARPVLFVPESKPLNDLLREFQRQQVHIAIVVDEYGGTAGVVTVEDLLEEIVGELSDGFSRTEPPVQMLASNVAVVRARATLDEVNEALGSKLESEDVDTIGGYVLGLLGKIPSVGDTVSADGLQIEVVELTGRRMRKVRITRTEPTAGEGVGTSTNE